MNSQKMLAGLLAVSLFSIAAAFTPRNAKPGSIQCPVKRELTREFCNNPTTRHCCTTMAPGESSRRTGPQIRQQRVTAGYTLNPYTGGDDLKPIPPRPFVTFPSHYGLIDPGHDDASGRIAFLSSVLEESGPIGDAFDVADKWIGSPYPGDLLGFSSVPLAGDADGFNVSIGVPGFAMVAGFIGLPDGASDVDDADFSVLGEAGSLFGFEQVTVGDFVAISAPNSTEGGTVYLTDLSTASGWILVDAVSEGSISPTTESSALGAQLESADTNRDGHDDLIVSAPGLDATYIFYGPLAELGTITTDDADVTLTGPSGSDAGYAIAVVYDADGDFSHLLIGAPSVDTVYVVSAAALSGSVALEDIDSVITGEEGSQFGYAVSGLGAAHLLVGAPEQGTTGAAYAFAITDSAQDDGDNVASAYTTASTRRLGEQVCEGRLDDDAFADIGITSVEGADEVVHTFPSDRIP